VTTLLLVIGAAVVGVVLLNLFSSGEKKVEHLPEHL
jgi:hypothetical protein